MNEWILSSNWKKEMGKSRDVWHLYMYQGTACNYCKYCIMPRHLWYDRVMTLNMGVKFKNLDIIRPWLGVNYVLFSSGWYRHHMRNKYLLKYNINLYLTFKQICGSFSTTKKYSSWITKKSIFKNLRFFCGPLLLYFWVTVRV